MDDLRFYFVFNCILVISGRLGGGGGGVIMKGCVQWSSVYG